jgi:Secretion system C-terminal sorting domain
MKNKNFNCISLLILLSSVCLHSQSLFWLEGGTSRLQSADLATFTPDSLSAGLSGAYGIATTPSAVYWTEPNNKAIKVAYNGAPAISTLINSTGIPRGIVVDGNFLYWTEAGTNKIRGAKIDGTNIHDVLVTTIYSPGFLNMDFSSHRLYWLNESSPWKSIKSCDTTGNNVKTVVANISQAWSFAIDQSSHLVYWINTASDSLQKADYSGTLPATPVNIAGSVSHYTRGIAFDAAHTNLYWSDDFIDHILRYHITGGAVDTLISAPYTQGMTIGSRLSLPIEIASFSATTIYLNAQLQWTTATEINNAAFEVERTITQPSALKGEGQGGGNWIEVGSIPGAGNSNSPKSYSFTDRVTTAGTYSYRLKQIDHNGEFKYSQEIQIAVGLAPKVFSLLQNYPNPFNPTTSIGFTVPTEGLATLRVYNTIGQEVATLFNDVAQAGEYHQATFDGSRLASGVYFARLQFGGKSLVKKLLMVK